ncbi:glycosyltransferase [Roseospira marina]|uniref:glycosyltransferase n=1 Tax=Roseospira marina TaxID=140057 RepID=UPI0014792640|nr:glycosyltransferase family 2 protein [Roseospira marina]MBB4314511.1 dolichol-phosphate mannosyltransferase [Roseospira marina]MBB5088661.1 dolichol-phosphate mannosyltransferase [Roseospira marina]
MDRQNEEGDLLAHIVVTTDASIVVPTYKEAENIPLVIDRVHRLRDRLGVDLELLFMDDDSRDGSVETVAACGFDWVRMIVRTENRGLSPAVIDGFRAARHPILICMDCDLSHPPEAIPHMILALNAGQQFVIGSRYVPGGSTDDTWGLFRWLNSAVATLLARPLTSARDPMSGFFALRKADFDAADSLSPVGYKIGLELIVKCGFENVGEVPIHFTDRQHGESKLSVKEQLKYIQHLRRLYIHQFGNAMHFLQFMVVGASGVVVNLSVLTVLVALGCPDTISLAGGILVSLVTNFLLNRRFTFSYARQNKVLPQFLGFLAASVVGMVVNYSVALTLRTHVFGSSHAALYGAALVGILCGMVFNFLGNRYLVFRQRFGGSPDGSPGA